MQGVAHHFHGHQSSTLAEANVFPCSSGWKIYFWTSFLCKKCYKHFLMAI